MKKLLLAFLVFLAVVGQVDKLYAQNNFNWSELQYFQIPNPGSPIQAGGLVSIQGNQLLIGKWYDNTDANGQNFLPEAGAAYIYEMNANGAWVQKQKLVPPTRHVGDKFGSSIAFNGNYAFIGTDSEDFITSNGTVLSAAGSVYIFHRNNDGTWDPNPVKIVPADIEAHDFFGSGIVILNDHAIVGAHGAWGGAGGIGDHPGKIYHYKLTAGTWTQIQKIASPSIVADGFGSAVTMNSNFAVVGAYTSNGFHGAVYIYKIVNGMLEVVPNQTITCGTPNTNPYWVGYSLSMDANSLLIGAPGSLPNGLFFIYQYTGSTWQFVKEFPLPSFVPQTLQYTFGKALSLSGDYAVVGCPSAASIGEPGYAFIYKKESGIWNDVPQQITGAEQQYNDRYGLYVSIDGYKAVVSSLGCECPGPTYISGGFFCFATSEPLFAEAGNDRTVCYPEGTTLGGINGSPTANGGIPPYTYLWETIPSSNWTSNEEHPFVNPSVNTTYKVTVQDNNGTGYTATDQVSLTVDSYCSCEFPVSLTGSGTLTAVGTTTDPSGSIFSLIRSTGTQFHTDFCAFKTWTCPRNGSNLVLYATDRFGIPHGFAAINSNELSSGVEPRILSSGSNAFLSLASNGSVWYNNTQLQNNSLRKTIVLLAADLNGNKLWHRIISNPNNDVSNPDISQDATYLYLVGTAPAGTTIQLTNGTNFIMSSNGVFAAKILKSTGGVVQAFQIQGYGITSKPAVLKTTLNNNDVLLVNLSGTVLTINLATSQTVTSTIYTGFPAAKDRLFKGNPKIYIQKANTIYALNFKTNGQVQAEWNYTFPSGTIYDVNPLESNLYFSCQNGSNSYIGYLNINGVPQNDFYTTTTPVRFAIGEYNSPLKGYTIRSSFGNTILAEGFYLPFAPLNCNKLVANAGENQSVCGGGSQITIGGNPTASGGTGTYAYQWSSIPASTIPPISNPNVYPTEYTTYTVSVTDVNHTLNCKTDDAYVSISKWPIIFTPNFTGMIQSALTMNSSGTVAFGSNITDRHETLIGNQVVVIDDNYDEKMILTTVTYDGTVLWGRSIGSKYYGETNYMSHISLSLQEDNSLYAIMTPSSYVSDNQFGLLGNFSDDNAFMCILHFRENGHVEPIIFHNPDANIYSYDIKTTEEAIYVTGFCDKKTVFGSLEPVEGYFIMKLDRDGNPISINRFEMQIVYGAFGPRIALHNEMVLACFRNNYYFFDSDLNMVSNGDLISSDVLKIASTEREVYFHTTSNIVFKYVYVEPNALEYYGFFYSSKPGSVAADNRYLYHATGYHYANPPGHAVSKIDFSEPEPQFIWDIFPAPINPPVVKLLAVNENVESGALANDTKINLFKRDSGEEECPDVIMSPAMDDGSLTNGPSIMHAVSTKEDGFRVFPNPATNSLNIILPAAFSGNGMISIQDNLGRTHLQQEVGKSQTISKLNVSSIPQGIYIVKLTGNGETKTQKILISR